MALVVQLQPALGRLWHLRGLGLLAGCLMLGACAQSGPQLSAPNLLAQAELADSAKGAEPQAARTQTELEKATEWWGKKYAQDPRDLEAALSYARNLKAMGEKKRAFAVLQQASIFHGEDKRLAGEYGRLALEYDQVSLADRLLDAADDPVNPDWRIISARGTVLAKQGKYGDAIPFFERALSLSHDQPSVLSNLALAHAMNGEPDKAERLLRQAAASDGTSLKIRQNLALVLGLQGKYDEAKLLASQDISPQNAAENTEYLRRIVKLEPQRIPAPAAPAAPQIAAIPQPQPASTQVAETKVAQAASARKPARVAQLPVLPVRKPAVAPQQKRDLPSPVIAAMKPAIEPDSGPWATQVALSDARKREGQR